jgi:fumarate hydratase class II
MIHNLLHSIRLMKDACHGFVDYAVVGHRAQPSSDRVAPAKLADARHRPEPHIGYDNAAKLAKNAHKKGISLRESAVELGLLTGEQFDQYVKPEEMTHPLNHPT